MIQDDPKFEVNVAYTANSRWSWKILHQKASNNYNKKGAVVIIILQMASVLFKSI